MSLAHAIEKVREGNTPWDVGVSYAGEASTSRDGIEWLFWAADADTTVEGLRVGISGSALAGVDVSLDPERLEAAVESVAGRFPRQSTLACMSAVAELDGYLTLTSDDLRFVTPGQAFAPDAK